MRILTTLACILLIPGVAGAQELPEVPFEPVVNPRVRIVTNLGAFVIELDVQRAPFTVENFLSYVEQGHYAGTIFHRVIHGFIAQGGGFTPDFVAKPTQQAVINESGNGLGNLRGTVGLARTTLLENSSEGLIADNADLNPRPTRWGYAVFGRVIEGMDVVDEIGQKPTGPGGEFARDVPVEMIVIESAEILSE